MIGLDLGGVMEMIDIIGGVHFDSDDMAPVAQPVNGRRAVDLLTREPIPSRDKQRLLRDILFQTGSQELTKVGWTLLKIGYHSLSTDLTITDLLELRKVTHTITPDQMTYRELP